MNLRFRILLTSTSLCPWSLFLLVVYPYINWMWAVGGSAIGMFFWWNFGANIAQDEQMREMISLYQDSHFATKLESMFHPKYWFGFVIYGAGLGFFAGMTLSASVNIYYDMPLQFGVIFSSWSILTLIATVCVSLTEIILPIRDLFSHAYFDT